MYKKTISLMLVFMMVLSLGMPLNVYGATNDYTGHWAEQTIKSWFDKGYATGYPDGFRYADKIIVLKQGEIVEMGNHAYLMEKNGYYKTMIMEGIK